MPDSADEHAWRDGFGPLMEAVEAGDLARTRRLVEGEAHPDAITMVLLWASRRGHTERVRTLIQAGADVNAQWQNTGTALGNAVLMGYREMVALLLEAGADPNAPLVLTEATWRGDPVVVRWLLERGADPLQTNFQGNTPLAIAVEYGRDEVAALLRQAERAVTT